MSPVIVELHDTSHPEITKGGTSADELFAVRLATLEALRTAAEKLHEMAPNRRDYQTHVTDWNHAFELHAKRREAIEDMMKAIESELGVIDEKR